jgi:hypothetical protein
MAQASVFAAPESELTALGKTSLLERIYFGAEQTGPFVERVSKLEKEIMWNESSSSLLEKVDSIDRKSTIFSAEAQLSRVAVQSQHF